MPSARQWNKLQASRRRNRLLDFRFDPPTVWQHFWYVTPGYDPKASQWACTLKPGFVNGLAATIAGVQLTATPAPRLPLTTFRALGDPSSPTGASTNADGSVTLSFEAVPPFFTQFGLSTPSSRLLDGGNTPAPVPTSDRLLVAADIALFQPRLSTTVNYQTSSALGDTTTLNFNPVTSGSSQTAKTPPHLAAFDLYTPPDVSDPIDWLTGNAGDPGYDSIRVATVYLLSPSSPQSDTPDGAWQPFVRHWLFWNLDHGTSKPDVPVASQNLSLITGLAGGVGDTVNQFLLSQVNDANSAIAQLLTNNNLTGQFWSV